MRRLCGAVALVWAGCVHVEVDKRVERGPLLRRFERPAVAEGGILAEVGARWPTLKVSIASYDRCLTQQVEEYAEEHIVERTAQSAGPALAMGITTSLIGGGLLLGRPLFSEAPNRSVIDGAGRYGPSDRQLATGWGVTFIALGAPALVVGILSYVQSGEEVTIHKGEQVVGVTERQCNVRPIDGEVVLDGTRRRARPEAAAAPPDWSAAEPVAEKTSGGIATFDAAVLSGQSIDGLRFNGRPVELTTHARAALDAFSACLGAQPPERVEELSTDALVEKLRAARECRAVEGAPAADWLSRLEAEAARRRDGE